jgi:hypothetical protein
MIFWNNSEAWNRPLPDKALIPLARVIHDFYIHLYSINKKAPKPDRFGICLRAENKTLELMEYITTAALHPGSEREISLTRSILTIEILKRLIRVMVDTKSIPIKSYLLLEEKLQAMSKMANGWLKYARGGK